MAMLEGVSELTLELLNSATQAWVEQEYQRTRPHRDRCTPLARYPRRPRRSTRECPAARPCAAPSAWRSRAPSGAAMARSAWRASASRFPRATGTCSTSICAMPAGTWRHRLVDARTRHRAVRALSAGQVRQRQWPAPCARTRMPDPHAAATRSGMAPLLRRLMAEYAATGLPPAYLPTDQESSS